MEKPGLTPGFFVFQKFASMSAMRDYRPSKSEQEQLKLRPSRRSHRFGQSVKKPLAKETSAHLFSRHQKPLARSHHFLVTTNMEPTALPEQTGNFRYWNWLVGFLLICSLPLFYFSIRQILDSWQAMTGNQKVLLLREQQPLAYIFFNVAGKETMVIPLQSAVAFQAQLLQLQQEASLEPASTSSQLAITERPFVPALLLKNFVDQVISYPSSDISKTALEQFFANDKEKLQFLRTANFYTSQNMDLEQIYQSKTLREGEKVFDCPIAVINTTGQAGFANALAEILDKSNFSIIRKDSDLSQLSQTTIRYDATPACQEIIQRLQRFLPTASFQANAEQTQTYRAAVVIFLGQDLGDTYQWVNRSLVNDE